MTILFKRQPLVCLLSKCGVVTCHEVGDSINFKRSSRWRQGTRVDYYIREYLSSIQQKTKP